jgi:hypothetical protein
VAAALASRKGVTMRAVLRGVAAIGGASFTVNAVAKPLLPRRRLNQNERTSSSSFPPATRRRRGHPSRKLPMGLAVAPGAAAVAYSRVHTGVHCLCSATGACTGGGRGDGTVAANRGLPLVVVPAGALNHFARDIGVTEVSDAVEAVRAGSAIAVDPGGVRRG